MTINKEQLELLWQRFHSRIEGFQDFENTGARFNQNERVFKEGTLQRFESELGRAGIEAAIQNGTALTKVALLPKIIHGSLVNFRAWRLNFGETEETAAAVFRALLEVTASGYDRAAMEKFFAQINVLGIKPDWGAILALLWVLRPADYYPIQISSFRKLASELGWELPGGRVSAAGVAALLEMGAAFRTALAPWKPKDWIDVQSFMWTVCPDSYEREKDDDTKPEPMPSPPPPMKPALNQILYGPPGTGKTYSSIRAAARIVAGEALDDAAAKARFDVLCKNERVRLVTFHQSFSYEDFIEGIRPVMDEESSSARFVVRDGVFKVIALEALGACLERVARGDAGGFDARWSALMAKIGETGVLEIAGLGEPRWLLSASSQGNVIAVNKTTQKEFLCPRSTLSKVWAALQPKAKISSGESETAYGKSAHHHIIAAVYNYVQTLKPAGAAKSALPQTTEEKSQAARDYLDSGEASGWRMRAASEHPPYVLIIDEINRGNISRIFGELITLIEDDKRLGAENGLTVTLPASRELFAVPPNLFLLGTMNTADKSLALLDVALRRRFDFAELAPDFSKCAQMPEPMRAAMERLNERLEIRKDRDHRIGHAFFMKVKDETTFNDVFRRKVVPLLQEYFFNDAEGARYVLGEAADSGEAGFLRKLAVKDGDAKWQRTRWRWFTDVEPGMDCWARLQPTPGA